MKIVILGYSGSGKSTLASRLSDSLKIPLLHLDQVNFTSGWKERETADAVDIIQKFMAKDDWIIEGNYQKLIQTERLHHAEHILILQFSRWVCLKRALSRYFTFKGRTRPSMADGCEEKMDREFLWWLLYKGRDKEKQNHFDNIKREYPKKVTIITNQKKLDLLFEEYKKLV